MRRAFHLIVLASPKAYSYTLAHIHGQEAHSDLNPMVREHKLNLVAYQTSDLYYYDADFDFHLFEQLSMSPDWATFFLICGTMHRSRLGLFDLDPHSVD